MADPLSDLENMVAMGLANQSEPTEQYIRELIDQLCELSIYESITKDEAEAVARRLEERISVSQHRGSVLRSDDHSPWLDAAKARIEPYYWDNYRRYLISESFPIAGVTTLDDVTDRILRLMQDPMKEGSWDRRGMVVGHVQSGKTANYTGLICKAADAGYKVVIVIAGVHNNLRTQTQQRIDEGFVGRDSARMLRNQGDRVVGVGKFGGNRHPITFTNTIKDFNRATATSVGIPLQNLTEPVVFVVKKNTNTLRNLIEWLSEHSARGGLDTIGEPMLLIDDEADNASINIQHRVGEVSRINGQIRELLRLFDRSCYVGYTATPFANIFIDPDSDDEMSGEDLFPRSFIVSLDPPSNYFGPTTVFLDSSEQYIHNIDDNEDFLPIRHEKDILVTEIPQSLIDAIRTFIMGKTIRLARGQRGGHCSMLVNASRFIDVQHQLRNAIHAHLGDMQRSIRVNGALPAVTALMDPQISALREIWQREFNDTEFDWNTIQSHLHEAVSPVRVVEVNSRSPGTLDYSGSSQDGLNVIAVGGFSLSRGLTLEGLMVSYILRNSLMYDTLMQMGRWFGYRVGYQDLCRIWMPEEARGWYEHIAESIEELRGEFRTMEVSNATPEEFGLKVRSHPDALVVTARNKMGTSAPIAVNIGLAFRLIETHTLLRDVESLQHNRNVVQRLAQQLEEAGLPLGNAQEDQHGYLFRGVPVGPILNFLGDFQNHEASLLTNGEPVRRYIAERQEDELCEWDVLFVSVGDGRDQVEGPLGMRIGCQRRTLGKKNDARTLPVSNRQRVSSRGIERAGLATEQRERAEQEYREDPGRRGRWTEGQTIQYPDWAYRRERTKPLLMIHLIKIDGDVGDDLPPQPVVAWGISFPATNKEERRVEYVVNTTWFREHFSDDEDDDELRGDDE